MAVCDVHREGAGYVSWDWGKGGDRRAGGSEPARRAVNAHYAAKNSASNYHACNAYADYRELLEREDVEDDQVGIVHAVDWHVLGSVAQLVG